jgi:hypothetical protein
MSRERVDRLVALVCLVCLVYLIEPDSPDKPEKPDPHPLFHGRTLDYITPGSGPAAHRSTTFPYCGEALTFVPSFTGGSILMLGP